jgi:hypothetical protein
MEFLCRSPKPRHKLIQRPRPDAYVWSVIRDFGNYALWVEDVEETGVEDGRSGDAVGAVRSVRIGETRIRQKLLAHSDHEHSYTYGFCEPSRFAIRDYVATIRVTSIIDGDRAFIEWWATFDVTDADRVRWTTFFARSFAMWLASLCHALAGDSLR